MQPLTQSEKEILETFFVEHASTIQGWSNKIANRYDVQSDDLRQEFFLGAAKHLRKKGTLEGMNWLFAVQNFRTAEVVNKGMKGTVPPKQTVQLAPLEDWSAIELPDETTGPTREQRALLLKGLRKLPYKQRITIWGISYSHKDRTEIGEAIGVERRNVHGIYLFGVKQLKKLVKNKCKKPRAATCKMITMDGQTKPMLDWCKELEVGVSTYWMRKKYGWSDVDCLKGKPGISRKQTTPKMATIDGQTKPVKEWLGVYKISRECLNQRMRKGMPLVEAITTPLRTTKGQKENG